MSRLWTLVVGLILFFLIAGVCTRLHRPQVRRALLAGAAERLTAAGIFGVDLSHPGPRELVLRGAVADQATKDLAEGTVRAHPLVARVRNLLEVPVSDPTIADLSGRDLLAEDSFESALGSLRAPTDCRAALAEHLQSRSIFFESGSSDLAPIDEDYLVRVSQLLKGCPGVRLKATEHVDPPLAAGSNPVASQRCASKVLERLMGLGVDRERLVSVSSSESAPTTEIAGSASQRAIRLVELAVVEE